MIEGTDLIARLEALLFAAPEPVDIGRLAAIMDIERDRVEELVTALSKRYQGPDSGIDLLRVAGGYQIFTRPEHACAVERLVEPERVRLSRAALECLALVAYRQPVTRAEIEEVRGVQSGHTLKTLESAGLVTAAGRLDAPGRPIQYATTPRFLAFLGLDTLKDLPPLIMPAQEDKG